LTLLEITDRYEEIRETWRDETPTAQLTIVADLDDLLGELDRLEPVDPDLLDELRGRIEILMDEIEIGLGFEPGEIPDAGTPDTI